MYEIKSYLLPVEIVNGSLTIINQQSWYRYERNGVPILAGVSPQNYFKYSNSNLELVAFNAYITFGVSGNSFMIDYGLNGTFTFSQSPLDNYTTTLLLGSTNAVQAPYDYGVVSTFETARGHSLAIVAKSASTGASILIIRSRTDPNRHVDHHHAIHDNYRQNEHHHHHKN